MNSPLGKKILRFIVAGVLGFVINAGVYALLIYEFKVWYLLASIIAFIVALCASFFLQKLFTFREFSKHRSLQQFSFYFLFLFCNLAINTLLLWVLVSELHVDKLVALIAINAVMALWSYFVYERLIFRSADYRQSAHSLMPLKGDPQISIVIPCYNEEESIATVLRAIPAGMFEVIVVDNNCTDKTAAIATELGARVVSEKTPGYGAALKAGFRAARGNIVAAFDGDNQYPAAEVVPIAKYLLDNHLDFISAARFPLKDPGSMSLQRKIGNWGLTFAGNLIFGLMLADSQSGMWVFKREVLDLIGPKSDDMPFSQGLKIQAATNPKIRFAEYVIPYHPRIGESKLSPWRHGCILLIDLVRTRAGLA